MRSASFISLACALVASLKAVSCNSSTAAVQASTKDAFRQSANPSSKTSTSLLTMFPVGARPKQGLGRAASAARSKKASRAASLLTNMDVIKSRALFLLDSASPKPFSDARTVFSSCRWAVPSSESPEKHHSSTGMASLKPSRSGSSDASRSVWYRAACNALPRHSQGASCWTASPSALYATTEALSNKQQSASALSSLVQSRSSTYVARQPRAVASGRACAQATTLSSVGGSVKVARRGDAPRPRAMEAWPSSLFRSAAPSAWSSSLPCLRSRSLTQVPLPSK
mmetsp:Transcript_17181/g.49026  ORF Transcript_17181/g.49026 Transcript_17181/m.49026 type:complete len:284 (-) Transcript_17181:171-1022(-)